MRILLLTFYYPPDLSAGSFRSSALVEAIKEQANGDVQIDILTSMPNRYSSMACEAQELECDKHTQVRRIPLPQHQSGMRDQSRAFISFAGNVLKETRGKRWDVVVATSSRLMTAALGARVARRGGMRLYLDIRDLFTDTMNDLLAGKAMRRILPAFRILEKWTLKTADRVNLVSPGFLGHVSEIIPTQNCRTFTNGIDDEFLELDFSSSPNEQPVIVYAGNMGDGQGLHRIIPKAAQALGDRARIRLIGDGGRRKGLQSELEKAGVDNVQILDPVPRKQLYQHYREADYLLLHLNDHAAFYKVLPSKIFEYAATGKPILAGVSGYAAEFLKKEVPGAEVFAPCDEHGFVHAFETLENQGRFDREDFKEKFKRRRIMQKMARDILDLALEPKKEYAAVK